MCGVPAFSADLLQWAERTDEPSIIIGDVEAAELADRAGDQRLDVRLGGHVSFVEDGTAAVFLAYTDRRRASILIQVGHHHRRAFAGEAGRSRPPHTARRAGYHRNFVIESS